MSRLVAFLFLPLGACGLYFSPSQGQPDTRLPDGGRPDAGGGSPTLAHVTDFAGEGTIGGITAGAGHDVWIAYRRQVGGYYDPDVVTVVDYDGFAGLERARFTYTDEYLPVVGLAWDGAHLWIGYDAMGPENAHVAELDATTGAVLKTMGTDGGVHDLGWDGSHLLYANLWNAVEVVDPATGAQVARLGVPEVEDSTMRGVASWRGAIWVDAQMGNTLYGLAPDGHVVAQATTDVLDPGWNYAWDLQLAAFGDQLAIVVDSHVWVLQ